MSHQKRDEEPEINNHEEWEAGDPGNMPGMRDENVQNRQKLVRQFILTHRRAGYSRYRDVQPFYFANHTFQANVTQLAHYAGE